MKSKNTITDSIVYDTDHYIPPKVNVACALSKSRYVA